LSTLREDYANVSLDQATRADATAQETEVWTSPQLKKALFYAKLGWPVFPIHQATKEGCSCRKTECANIGKHPRTAHGFLDATTDENQIREWWEFDHPFSNIGVRTGKESGIVVLDIDPDKGGEESLRQLETQYEPLPNTPTVRSGGAF
jgi:putative DNA primase/helicase